MKLLKKLCFCFKDKKLVSGDCINVFVNTLKKLHKQREEKTPILTRVSFTSFKNYLLGLVIDLEYFNLADY